VTSSDGPSKQSVNPTEAELAGYEPPRGGHVTKMATITGARGRFRDAEGEEVAGNSFGHVTKMASITGARGSPPVADAKT